MFAPRSDAVVREVHRVLKPGGLFAFASWPPEHLMGRVFALVDTYVASSTSPDAAPQLWGDTHIIIKRLANFFEAPFFERGVMLTPALSKSHRRLAFERSFGPMRQALQELSAQPEKIQMLRMEMDDLIEPYCLNNQCHQSYLMSRSRVQK
jgi:SAM-dependent methyltransferase